VDTVASDWRKLQQVNWVRSERAAGLLVTMLTARRAPALTSNGHSREDIVF
jgi:hypothetical protein